MGEPPRYIPEDLSELTSLALDLFWTWSHAGDDVWARIDPDLWQQVRNPWLLLETVSPARLNELARDEGFRAEVSRLARERRRYLDSETWFSARPEGGDLGGGVAFFSLEFGLGEALPLYAGGLGVLAGDLLKTASDLGVPVYGVGLLYQAGYFRQILDAAGRQEEAYPYNEPASLPIRPVLDGNEGWLRVPLRLPGRTVLLRVWEALVGRTRLYLLDSNDPRNTASDRGITAKLYGGVPILRLQQELALGVGGWRALQALGLEPGVCHINEGHAAFAGLERVRALMERHGLTFGEAVWAARAGNVFTTHTPVDAGFDRFPPEMVRENLFGKGGAFADTPIAPGDVLALGRADPGNAAEPLNMAFLATRLSARVNGVSRLHGAVSRNLFAPLFPRWPEEEVPIGHVTNGVHMPTWDSAAADDLWTRTCGKERWRGGEAELCADVGAAADEDLWSMRAAQRHALVAAVRRELVHQLPWRDPTGSAPPDLEGVLDPNALTIGFARRFTEYKRPELLLRDADRLARILANPAAPVQLVIAGKAHPEDAKGKQSIARWVEFVSRPGLRRHAVFLEDYDIGRALELVQGIDLWINTPRRSREACGTSGMKVLVNGGLNLSCLDGWWDEAYAPDVGWCFGRPAPDDAADAADFYRVLEEKVIPEFYDRDASGLPRRWIGRMRASMTRLAAEFCSNRMLRDYLGGIYLPAAASYRRRVADGAGLARSLAAWERALAAHWEQMHLGRVETAPCEGGWRFSVHVQLGEIAPDMVAVELVADPAGSTGRLRLPMERGRAIPGVINGFEYYREVQTDRPAAHFTPRIVPAHPEASLPAELPLVRWQH
ncbi:MAG: alpha-glucan family phosphorylase [Alphaproteobacteria bacterium]|nr:alpha-glucan family phosphorylase [Alphaproteobacteria bacterium]